MQYDKLERIQILLAGFTYKYNSSKSVYHKIIHKYDNNTERGLYVN